MGKNTFFVFKTFGWIKKNMDNYKNRRGCLNTPWVVVLYVKNTQYH